MKDIKQANQVKKLRIQAGFSQEDLANKTQLSLRTIQRIENGETVPRGDSLQRISKALNFPVKDLNKTILKEDKGILLLLHLSVLGFLVFPLLGIIAPTVIWLLFKDKIAEVGKEGRKILRSQIYWLSVLAAIYLFIFCLKIFNVTHGFPANINYKLIIIGLYIYNLIVVLFNIIDLFRNNHRYTGKILSSY